MKANQKNKQPKKAATKPAQETLEQRVHRHITDKNSKITDDDIRNVRTELEIRGETNPDQLKESGGKNKRAKKVSPQQKKENEPESDQKQTTPWNLLSEGYD